MRLCCALLVLACAALGCKSLSVSPYVSPRITGRVVDSETRLPIYHVKVRRLPSQDSHRSMEPAKGGQVVDPSLSVYTDRDGRFTLDSVRALTTFRRVGWYAVSLSFEHSRYCRFATSYTLANATNSVKGEPLVNAGEIPLIPRFQ